MLQPCGLDEIWPCHISQLIATPWARISYCWSSRAKLDYCHHRISIENPAAPPCPFERAWSLCEVSMPDLQHPVKGDDNYYIIFTRDNWKTKRCKFRNDNLLSLLTDDTERNCNARASANVGANRPIPLTCCQYHRPWLLRNPFCSSISHHSRLQTTPWRPSFPSWLRIWTSTPSS